LTSQSIAERTMPDLDLARFTAWVGERFHVRGDQGDPVTAELIEARRLPGAPFQGRTPFSVLFRGPASPVLPQSIYHLLRDGDAEPLDIFLVPVGVNSAGACYEAVFN
jgi:hypothetical protein